MPPFHADTPAKVFENILSRRIDWHEDDDDVSADARDLMNRLICTDPQKRLGVNGADEVKRHPFFKDIDWPTVCSAEAPFVPQIQDPESTDYFDSRGAAGQVFTDDDAVVPPAPVPPPAGHPLLGMAASEPNMEAQGNRLSQRGRSETAPPLQDDFGAFQFKNLPVLKQANDDVIKKFKGEQMLSHSPIMNFDQPARHVTLAAKGKSRTAGALLEVR